MENICIPMHLDAFALSPDCCTGLSNLAPYTQPNYTSLRLDTHLIQHDVLDHIDFHNTSEPSKNPRIADLGGDPTSNLKRNRMGIHLHWSLPRFYRTALASGVKERSDPAKGIDKTNPKFPTVPNRWLIVRHFTGPQRPPSIPEYKTWVIESDSIRHITSLKDPDLDIESDLAPFVSYVDGNSGDPNVLSAQTEVFLGQKFDDLQKYARLGPHSNPRLTLMNSSNPLFPDYALHNTNVFSMIDNFSFRKTPESEIQYLDNVQCDYFVVGWHSDRSDDPLAGSDAGDLITRLKSLHMQLGANATKGLGVKEDSTRCLLFGAMYNVKFDLKKKPLSAADHCARHFMAENNPQKPFDTTMEPISVGTTPLDSMLTFLEAHKDDADAFFTEGSSIAKEVMEMSQFLYASADQYDARVQAQDLISQQNYAKAEGGLLWSSAKPPTPSGGPAIPDSTEAGALKALNEAQSKLDVCNRKARSLRWDLFAEWWKWVSEYRSKIHDMDKRRQVVQRAALTEIFQSLAGKDSNSGTLNMIRDLNATIENLKSSVASKSAVKDPFFTRTDPTLSIAGLESGWPVDFLSALTVLTHKELTADDGKIASFLSLAINPVPKDNDLHKTAVNLLAQCLRNSDTKNGARKSNGDFAEGPPKTTGFQAWGDSNPFSPLFMEWEAYYYHVGWDKWAVQVRPSPVGHAHSQVRYVPKETLASGATAKEVKDMRIVSGRTLILPQPIFSLQNTVKQLIESQPAGLADVISEAEQADLYKKVDRLQFISTTLSGLTNHLLTRCEGAHVKPLVRIQGGTNTPLKVAADAFEDIVDAKQLNLPIDGRAATKILNHVGDETALTPYGTLMAFGEDQYPKPPFKAVTHGQLAFTKINIVDKFGQAICLPKAQGRRLRQQTSDPPKTDIFPCISDYLAPDVDEKSRKFNTVFPTQDPKTPGHWPHCQFMQLTPAINQDARINASFLIRDSPDDPWREANEYEQPIWGWIVINYADNGLQFFQANGHFYQEVRLGGVTATTTSRRWIPEQPPKSDGSPSAAMSQLVQLIDQFSPAKDNDGNYLQAFFNMINGSIQTMPFPPSDYSGYANAIVGKPLALVNVGWSIELAAPAIKPQNTLPMDDKGVPKAANQAQAQTILENYSFPLKIGDLERSFDGVVGYYRCDGQNPKAPPGNTNARLTNFDTLYTYFVPKPAPKVKEITPDVFPELHPYYLDPLKMSTTKGTPYIDARADKYTVTSLIIDPYTPLHGYSPILPTKTIKLPSWTIQTAFQNMHAFFHLGPNLYTHDVPKTEQAAQDYAKAGGTVKMPVSGAKGTWRWLQPYEQPGDDVIENFVGLDVQEDMGQVKFEKAPYTFLEGYLQLMGSLKVAGK